jgi:predicted nucleic acid-binding protein
MGNAVKPKIYPETSLFGFYSKRCKDAECVGTVELFNRIDKGRYEAYISEYVNTEMQDAPELVQERLAELIKKYKITVLDTNDEIKKLADRYISEKVVPASARTDALHLATATVYGMDIIVSMNLKHIVKPKTIFMTERINMDNGYRAVKIKSPMEVMNDE